MIENELNSLPIKLNILNEMILVVNPNAKVTKLNEDDNIEIQTNSNMIVETENIRKSKNVINQYILLIIEI